jgi:hypothetical protein
VPAAPEVVEDQPAFDAGMAWGEHIRPDGDAMTEMLPVADDDRVVLPHARRVNARLLMYRASSVHGGRWETAKVAARKWRVSATLAARTLSLQ